MQNSRRRSVTKHGVEDHAHGELRADSNHEGETLSDVYEPSNGLRARTDFNSPMGYGMSTGGSVDQFGLASGPGSAQIVQSMQERNNQMRGDARIHNHNLHL